MIEKYIEGKALINGKWKEVSGGVLDVISPSDGKKFSHIGNCLAADVDEAVIAAREASEKLWRRMPAAERGRFITKLGLKIKEHLDELAEMESRDTGKPLKQGKSDINATLRYCEYFGGAADKLHGDTIPFLQGYNVMTVFEPHGVTGHIIPWNYPAQMTCRTLLPALATGNTVVLKPAEDAAMTPLMIAYLATEVGFPDGVINVVPGLGTEAGAALSAHKGIDFMSFTGSPAVGTLVQQAAAKNHNACTLELGGKSPQLVFADVDIEKSLPSVCNAIVQNAGQTCSAGSRVLIQESIYEEYIKLLAAKFNNIKVGAHYQDFDCGPLINKKQLERVNGYVEKAKQQGIEVIAQGQLDNDAPDSGFYSIPTLFSKVPPNSQLGCEEVFGPVLSAIPFKDDDDAIAIANNTDYGLVAGVWTNNGPRQFRMAQEIQVGQVFINNYGAAGGIELPFGGVKKSGYGREKGFSSLLEFCSEKTIIFNNL